MITGWLCSKTYMFSADKVTKVTRVHPHRKQTKEVLNCKFEGGRPMNHVVAWP
jgi:hypothetical protein